MNNTIFNMYQVYYMNNDGQKEILYRNKSYVQAIKICQENYTAWATNGRGYGNLQYEAVIN